MSNVHLGKRVFTLAVVAMTILWTVAAGLSPLMTNASGSLSAGDIITGESFSTLYYYATDGKRYTFPNEKTYFSWYEGFDSVVEISDAQLAGIPLGGNVVYRPGTNWVKIQSDPKVYVVSPDGVLHWVESEAVATALYGSADWNTFVHDVPDTFFADYSVGASLMTADGLFDGALVTDGSATYLYWDGELREVVGAGMSANGLQGMYVLETTVDLTALAAGADLDAEYGEISDTAQMVVGGGTPVVTGGLSLSLASDTPAGATLPGGANGVELAKWRVSASGGDSTLDSLVVSLGGIGGTGNVTNVYLYEGDIRLTDARSINSATRQATFSNLGFDVADGAYRYLSAVVETSTAAGGGETASLSIGASTDVGTSGSVSGSFPLSGNTFAFSATDAGTVTVTRSGTIVDPTLGQQDAEVAKFKLAADNEAASVERLRLEVNDAKDHSDFRLWQGTDQVATGVNTSGDYVDFEFSTPYAIAEGADKIFTMTMDVGGKSSELVRTWIERTTDLVAVGGDFGFNMQVDIGASAGSYNGADGADAGTTACSASTDTSDNCSLASIQGGDVTFVDNSPTSSDIGIDSKDVVLLAFSLTAQEEVTVKDLPVIVWGDDDANANPFEADDDAGSDNDSLIRLQTEQNIKDVSIRYADSGVRLMGPLELSLTGNDGFQVMQFSDDFTVAAGTTLDLEVTVDVDNTVASGEEYGASLDLDGSNGTLSIRDANDDALVVGTNIVPSSDIVGGVFTTAAASIDFALASSPGSFTTVQGSEDENLIAFSVDTGDAEDITVTSLTLTAYGDADGAGVYTKGGEATAEVENFLSSCSLYDGDGGLLDGPKGPTANGDTFVFDGINWTVDAGAVERMDVFCNLQNPSELTSSFFSLDIDDASADIVSQDEDGDDVVENLVAGDQPNAATSPTVAMTVNATGSLAVTADSSTPDSGILTSNTASNLVSVFRLAATNEDFEVTTFSVFEYQAEADGYGVGATDYMNNISKAWLEYPDADGVMQLASATPSGQVAKFNGLDMYIADSDNETVNVYIDVPKINRTSGGDAQSGERVLLGFYDDNAGSDDSHFRAVGQGSNDVLNEGDVSEITAGINDFEIRETVPTISLNGASPSGQTLPGNSEALRFEVAASGNNDVVIDEIMFEMFSTDNAGSSIGWNECDSGIDESETTVADFSLYNMSNLGSQLEDADSDWTLYYDSTADAQSLGSCATDVDGHKIKWIKLENMADDMTIAAGTTEVFSLWFDSSGASTADDDSLRFDIPDDPIISVSDTDGWGLITEDVAGISNVTSTTITASADLTEAGHGDIVCHTGAAADETCVASDERMLVTNNDSDVAVNGFFAYRGYLGSTPANTVNTSELVYIPSALVWYDDGDTTNDASVFEDEVAGAYLLESLPIVGGTLLF